MKTFEIDCVEITESYDRDTNHVAYASDLIVANAIILDRPEGARPYLHPSKFKKTFVIVESVDEYRYMTRDATIARIKSKLTKEEIALLGI